MNNGEEMEPAAAHLVLLLGDKACTMHIRKAVFGRGYERKKLFNTVFAKSKRDLALISAL